MNERTVRPKNKTALAFELSYRGVGNPPASEPRTAVGNFFPGLEFNFQNVWKRIFKGIELLESSGQVIAVDLAEVDEEAKADLQGLWLDAAAQGREPRKLKKSYLIGIEYKHGEEKRTIDLLRYAHGPGLPERDAPGAEFEKTPHFFFLEWANALADVHASLGGKKAKATCHFLVEEKDQTTGLSKLTKKEIQLGVRRLIAEDTALIDERVVKPGEITESLCSPWQTDYIGCACFYWASNRPDFVNVEHVDVKVGGEPDTLTLGHHWLNIARDSREVQAVVKKTDGTESRQKPFYTLDRARLLQHEDVMKDWEYKFEFVIKGKDVPDGVVGGPAQTDKNKRP